MWNGLKAIVFASLFMYFFFFYVPLRLILQAGTPINQPVGLVGLLPLALGFALSCWCVWEFLTRGQGTPAVFDPPKRLVIRGPYAYVRNPMYVGAVVLLTGIAILYASRDLAVYALGFGVATHLLVVLYEEGTLGRKFGSDYLAYKTTVRRWIPSVRARG